MFPRSPSQAHVCCLSIRSHTLRQTRLQPKRAHYGISLSHSIQLKRIALSTATHNQIKTIDLLAQFHFNSFHACCSVSQTQLVFFLLSFCFVSFRFISMKNHNNATVYEEKKSSNNPIALLAIGIDQKKKKKKRRKRKK